MASSEPRRTSNDSRPSSASVSSGMSCTSGEPACGLRVTEQRSINNSHPAVTPRSPRGGKLHLLVWHRKVPPSRPWFTVGAPTTGNDSTNTCHSTLGPGVVEWALPLPCVTSNWATSPHHDRRPQAPSDSASLQVHLLATSSGCLGHCATSSILRGTGQSRMLHRAQCAFSSLSGSV